MSGRNAVGTPSSARRGLADGKIALGLQSQTSTRQAASRPYYLAWIPVTLKGSARTHAVSELRGVRGIKSLLTMHR
jgi:hypothetical protein